MMETPDATLFPDFSLCFFFFPLLSLISSFQFSGPPLLFLNAQRLCVQLGVLVAHAKKSPQAIQTDLIKRE